MCVYNARSEKYITLNYCKIYATSTMAMPLFFAECSIYDILCWADNVLRQFISGESIICERE